jgi:hypothetical protein
MKTDVLIPTCTPQPCTHTYEAVRYNALTHGILSRLAVLPHEDRQEFATLLEALVAEHRPTGATEMHLVEELGAIIWRKRRVLLAEGATINRGLRQVVRSSDSPVPAAVPFEIGMSQKETDLSDLLSLTPDDVAETQQLTAADLQATEKALAILRCGDKDAYKKALKALATDSFDWWQEELEKGEYSADAAGLAEFISDQLYPLCLRLEKEARHHEAIKAQTIGEGLQAHRLQNLNRYETHLDRKFERTLAMLVKLKEMRERIQPR